MQEEEEDHLPPKVKTYIMAIERQLSEKRLDVGHYFFRDDGNPIGCHIVYYYNEVVLDANGKHCHNLGHFHDFYLKQYYMLEMLPNE